MYGFLISRGELGRRIAEYDWSPTGLGPIEQWPPHLRHTIGLMLQSEVPMVLLWGEDGIMIYNDAYSRFAGMRDSRLLGSKVREGWHEVADFNDNVMKVCLAGGTLKYRDHALILDRQGQPESARMDLDYSPIVDDAGKPAGVLAIVVETTAAYHVRATLEANEARLRFLDSLGRATAASRDADDVLNTITRMTAQHIGVTNCAYADMDSDQDGFTIRGNWHAPGSASIVGHYKLADFGALAVQELGAGRPLIVNDISRELPAEEAKTFRDIGIDATICMPLIKGGRLIALMAVHDKGPRIWSDNDLALIGEVTERSWAHVERVGAEQVLIEREEQLRRSQEAGGVGLFVTDVATNRVTGTPEFCRIFGIEFRENIAAEDVERLVVPEDIAVGSDLERRRNGTATLDVEYRIRRGDTGEERIIARKADYERDASGKPIRLVGVVQDITERQRIQQALEKSEASFSALAQKMPIQVWRSRADGFFEWFNSQIHAYSGLPDGALNGEGWVRIVHPEDRLAAFQLWRHALATGETFETEFRLRSDAGDFRWFLARAVPLRDQRQHITSWVGTNTDIHDQKMSQAASVRDRNRLWSMTQDILLVCDHEGRVTAINPSVTTVLGWREDQLIGRLLTDFVHEDDWARTAAEFPRLMTGITSVAFENRYRTADGDYRLLDWTAVPDGNRIHGVGRDITDQRAMEDALRQSQKMEAVGQLTGGIAHDFNNLLQGIIGSLDIMERRLAQGRTQELGRWFDGAKSSAQRAAALTHRLLAFSRRQPLDPRPVQANPLIASMEDLLRRTLGETVTLDLRLHPALWLTRCDPNQLENAILNLAINARDAMPDGGTLTIETDNVTLDGSAAIRHRDLPPGDYIAIRVADTGTGMDRDTVERAFEPFFTTKPIGQGTGLGLSMIYGFARQSQGHTQIESTPGSGTAIRLLLPRIADQAQDTLPPDELTELKRTRNSEVVLVVEDEAIVRLLIVDILEELGYATIEAADGTAGVEILGKPDRIDLLITDIGLPGINGRQVADTGRTLRPDLKILFMTGYAENAALAEGFLQDGMELITKPFTVDALAAKIREMIELARQGLATR